MDDTAPRPEPPHGRSGRRIFLVVGLVLLAGAAGVGRWFVTRPEYRLARGEDAIQTGEWETVESYAAALEESGAADHAHYLRGESLRVRKRPGPALAEYNKVRATQGALHLKAATASGLCLIDLRNLREASRVLEYVVQQDPDRIDAHRGLAALAFDLGQLSRAVHHLEEVARLDPQDGRPYRLIGLIHKDLGNNELAATAYVTALARQLGHRVREEVQVELAEVEVRLARFSEALARLDALPPGEFSSQVAAIRAETLRGLGRANEAIPILDAAIAERATADLLRLRGQLALDAGQFPEAASLLERARVLGPADYQVQFNLARAYAGAGRAADADAANEKAEALRRDLDLMTALSKQAMEKPFDPAVRLKLADTAERLQKPELAAMWRKAADECRPR
jgi:Flp pilus assembly protein TadD